MKATRYPTVQYDPAMDYDGGQGGLRIYIPDEKGYINYNLVHTVVEEKNADTWRMTIAFEADTAGNLLRQLTKGRAEWEMAVRRADRPDFIGGYNHGDERYTALKLVLDGKETTPEALTSMTAFQQLCVTVRSVGYDPKAQSDAVFEHEKEFHFTQDGVTLFQKITWLGTYELDQNFKSFLAMMPPLKYEPKKTEKAVTDTFYTDQIPESTIRTRPIGLGKTKQYCVFGRESKIAFTMTVDDYQPLDQNSYQASLTDNGGHNNYNKMYISFAGGVAESVAQGTVWKATTHYQIKHI